MLRTTTCIRPSNNYMFGFDILLHVFILALIVSLFYFLYVADLSSRLFKEHIDNVIDKELIETIKKSDTNGEVKNLLKNIDLERISDYYNKQDKIKANQNKWLKSVTATLIITLFIVIIILYYSTKNFCRDVPISKLIKSNIIIFLAIGIVEVLFFIKIGKNYIPIKPSLLLQTFIDSIVNVF